MVMTTRTVLYGAVCAALVLFVGTVFGAAQFPLTLFTYTEPVGPITKADFSQLGEEVAAIEQALGTNLRNIVTQDARCFVLESPSSSETFENVWIAPYDLTVSELYCEITSGTSVEADVEIDDGNPNGVNGANIVCNSAGVTVTPAGDTTALQGERFDLALGTVTGSVAQVAMCMTYGPSL